MKKTYISPRTESSPCLPQELMIGASAQGDPTIQPSNYGHFGQYGSYEEDDHWADNDDESNTWDKF